MSWAGAAWQQSMRRAESELDAWCMDFNFDAAAIDGSATTLNGQVLRLEDLQRLEEELKKMPKPVWTLIGPDGRAWQAESPHRLMQILAGASLGEAVLNIPNAP